MSPTPLTLLRIPIFLKLLHEVSLNTCGLHIILILPFVNFSPILHSEYLECATPLTVLYIYFFKLCMCFLHSMMMFIWFK